MNVIGTIDPNRHSQMDVLGMDGLCSTLDTLKERKKVAIPIYRGGYNDMSEIVGNTHPSGRGMNGYVYYSEGDMTTLTTNKGEGNKIAIPVREATKQGYAYARGGGTPSTLQCREAKQEEDESG